MQQSRQVFGPYFLPTRHPVLLEFWWADTYSLVHMDGVLAGDDLVDGGLAALLLSFRRHFYSRVTVVSSGPVRRR